MKMLLAAIVVFLNSSCTSQEGKQAAQKLDSAVSAFASGEGILLDVRTPGEYRDEHIPGAINIDYNDEGFSAALDTLDKSSVYKVYCRSGRRSSESVRMMQEKGFSNLKHLDGGILKWKENGMKTIKGEKH